MTSTAITGTIKTLQLSRGFGFIKTDDGDVFFHCKTLAPGLIFDERLEGSPVKLTVEDSDKGSRASKVWAA